MAQMTVDEALREMQRRGQAVADAMGRHRGCIELIPAVKELADNYTAALAEIEKLKAALEVERHVRGTAERESMHHAERTAELYIEREKLQEQAERNRHCEEALIESHAYWVKRCKELEAHSMQTTVVRKGICQGDPTNSSDPCSEALQRAAKSLDAALAIATGLIEDLTPAHPKPRCSNCHDSGFAQGGACLACR